MAKKLGKKVKEKKKPVKKAVAKKPAAKKVVAKPAKKAAPKKAAPKAVAKKVVVKKAAKPVKASPKKVAAPVKPEKPSVKAKREKEKVQPEAPVVEEVVDQELEAGAEEDLTEAEVVLTDAEGRRYCRVKDCDQLAAVDGYCRFHYLALWKKIQIRKKILSEGKLERYIEELTARYPDKFLDMLRKDLRSEKEFLAAIQELEIDESAVDNEFEDEAQTYIDEVRGMGEPAAREEEDF